ncbi:MAG: hypothetical protein HY017_17955 [Betaproteobacteria bacterium]|nr:hypothetical protein [Betaproteobacteria bacterium]
MFGGLRLLTPGEVPFDRLQVFRYSPLSRILATVISGAIVLCCIWIGWRGGIALGKEGAIPGFIAWWVAFWIGIYFLFVAADLRKILRPQAWLAVAGEDGVFLKWRSYLNAHWGSGDVQVVFIPYRAIAGAGAHARTWLTRGEREGGSREERHSFVELRLAEQVDTTELAKRLAEERDGRPSGIKQKSRWGHFPVSVEPENVLRIEWRARPGTGAFIDILRGHGIAIEQTRTSRSDLRDPADPAQLAELARRGDTMTLIRVLRTQRDISLADAKTRADAMIREARGGGI